MKKELGITKAKLMYPKGDGCYLQGIEPEKVYSAADYDNLLERYNEAIEVLENVKRLETLIRHPDDVSIMHEGEAKAIHMMLNEVEQTISKANENRG